MNSSAQHCEQCGQPLSEAAKFCAACGAPAVKTPAPNSSPPPAPQRRRWQPSTIVGALALCAVVIALAASALRSDEDDSGVDDGPDPAVVADRAAKKLCAELWNDETNATVRQIAGTGSGDVYVSIGFAEDFPDKCLVTIAYPSTNRAQQYLQAAKGDVTAAGGTYSIPQGNLTVANLDPSVKRWNAAMGEGGYIGYVDPE